MKMEQKRNQHHKPVVTEMEQKQEIEENSTAKNATNRTKQTLLWLTWLDPWMYATPPL